MREIIRGTPSVARKYCPACEPDADPSREILDVLWCEKHVPSRDGKDDALAKTSDVPLSRNAEAGGDNNRRWCEALHRR
ncbi:MAG: hypothetical protein HYT39_03450 [Candidatus Sungbacteria bacterium]|nr:hypothetical protein [Candidatus Sungbacteria bacterium]